MRDCSRDDIKDLLPDYALGHLDAAAASEVATHLATCQSCVAELAVVRAAHAAFKAPTVDIAQIVRALPTPVTPLAPRIEKRSRRFMSWRVAAMIGTIAVGGVSVAMLNGILGRPPHPHTRVVGPPAPVDKPNEVSGLSVGGNLNDLSDKEMQALLDKLDELDAVPSAEPQPAVSGMRAAAGVQ